MPSNTVTVSGILSNVVYSFIAITTQSSLTQSKITCSGHIYGSNRFLKSIR